MGNMFIFMSGEHEASANTIQFIFLLLACLPSVQRSVQADIDRILARSSKTADQTSFEQQYEDFFESMVGAVVNEALRLFTVLPFILKATPRKESQTITVDGRSHVIPPDTVILMNTSATHRNPRYWVEPSTKDLMGPAPHVLAAFNPWMWLDGRRCPGNEDRKSGFLKPQPGTFLPFSDGSRGCLGTKFSLVELCAVVVRVFATHSVELSVRPSDIEDDSRESFLKGWEKARQRAMRQLGTDGVKFEMSLRMEGSVPLSFTRRGEEKVVDA